MLFWFSLFLVCCSRCENIIIILWWWRCQRLHQCG